MSKYISSIVQKEGDEVVTVPRDHDVLLGRGSNHWDHMGNRRFRWLVARHSEGYIRATSRMEKGRVIARILFELGDGRFLKRINKGVEGFIVVNSPRVIAEKIGHAIRDSKAAAERLSRLRAELQELKTRHPTTPSTTKNSLHADQHDSKRAAAAEAKQQPRLEEAAKLLKGLAATTAGEIEGIEDIPKGNRKGTFLCNGHRQHCGEEDDGYHRPPYLCYKSPADADNDDDALPRPTFERGRQGEKQQQDSPSTFAAGETTNAGGNEDDDYGQDDDEDDYDDEQEEVPIITTTHAIGTGDASKLLPAGATVSRPSLFVTSLGQTESMLVPPQQDEQYDCTAMVAKKSRVAKKSNKKAATVWPASSSSLPMPSVAAVSLYSHHRHPQHEEPSLLSVRRRYEASRDRVVKKSAFLGSAHDRICILNGYATI